MKEYELIGKIVKDEIACYRIIHYAQDNFVLCQLDVTQLNLQYYPALTLDQDLRNNRMNLVEDKIRIVDEKILSDKQKADFLNTSIVNCITFQ